MSGVVSDPNPSFADNPFLRQMGRRKKRRSFGLGASADAARRATVTEAVKTGAVSDATEAKQAYDEAIKKKSEDKKRFIEARRKKTETREHRRISSRVTAESSAEYSLSPTPASDTDTDTDSDAKYKSSDPLRRSKKPSGSGTTSVKKSAVSSKGTFSLRKKKAERSPIPSSSAASPSSDGRRHTTIAGSHTSSASTAHSRAVFERAGTVQARDIASRTVVDRPVMDEKPPKSTTVFKRSTSSRAQSRSPRRPLHSAYTARPIEPVKEIEIEVDPPASSDDEGAPIVKEVSLESIPIGRSVGRAKTVAFKKTRRPTSEILVSSTSVPKPKAVAHSIGSSGRSRATSKSSFEPSRSITPISEKKTVKGGSSAATKKRAALTASEVSGQFGKSIQSLDSSKVEGYDHPIPRVLLDLKRRLMEADGLSHPAIFHRMAPEDGTQAFVVSTLIRQWFTDLPVPFLDQHQSAVDKATSVDRVPLAVSLLPDHKQSVMLWLWDLLADVCEMGAENKMDSMQLGQSFGPIMTAVTERDIRSSRMSMAAMYASRVVIFMKRGIDWRLSLRGFGY